MDQVVRFLANSDNGDFGRKLLGPVCKKHELVLSKNRWHRDHEQYTIGQLLFGSWVLEMVVVRFEDNRAHFTRQWDPAVDVWFNLGNPDFNTRVDELIGLIYEKWSSSSHEIS